MSGLIVMMGLGTLGLFVRQPAALSSVLQVIGSAGPAFLAAALSWVCSNHIAATERKLQHGFRIFAFGFALRAIHQILSKFAVPLNSDSADWGAVFSYIGSTAFIIWGFGVMALVRVNARSPRIAMDALIATVCGLSVLFVQLLQPLLEFAAAGPADALVRVAFPVLGVIAGFAGFTFTAIFYSSGRRDWWPTLLFAAALVEAGHQVLGGVIRITANYQPGGLHFGLLSLSYALWCAALIAFRREPEFVDSSAQSAELVGRTVQFFGNFMPLAVAVLTAFYVAIRDLASYGYISPSVGAILVLTLCLVGFRQAFAVREAETEAKRISDQFADLYQQKTRELRIRYDLVRSLAESKSLDQLIEVSLQYMRRMVPANQVFFAVVPDVAKKSSLTGRFVYGADEAFAFSVLTHLNKKDSWVSNRTVEDPKTGETTNAAIFHHHLYVFGKVVATFVAVRYEGVIPASEKESVEAIMLEITSGFSRFLALSMMVESAEQDYLTSTYNHGAILRRLDAFVEHMQPVSVLVVDLAGFKLFNDTFGTLAGDELLREFAKRFETMLAPHRGIVGRTSGDEFVGLVPDADVHLAYKVATSIRQNLELTGFRLEEYPENIPISVNIGIAVYPHSGNTVASLLTAANDNLKNAQKNQVVLLLPEDEQASIDETHMSLDPLDMMLSAIDNFDDYTMRHSLDVMRFSVWLAEEIGMSQAEITDVMTAAKLHDIGKIAIPHKILLRPGRLRDDEFELMKQHPVIGAQIVGGIPSLQGLVGGIRSHHERWDGLGYPDHLAGEAIPFMGRLLAVADAFSAMTTNRTYRKGMDWAVAARRIQEGSGTHFDPRLAAAFVRCLEKQGIHLDGQEPPQKAA